MPTKIVRIRELQRRLSELLQEAHEKGISLIVMRHSVHLGTFTPARKKRKTRKEILLEELARDVAEAREQVKRGEVYTEEEIARELGITL